MPWRRRTFPFTLLVTELKPELSEILSSSFQLEALCVEVTFSIMHRLVWNNNTSEHL